MEAKKLHKVNINATVFAPFSLSWSENDKIVVPTKEGINILELIIEPDNDKARPTLRHSRVDLTLEQTPASCADIHCDDIVASGQRLDAYKIIMDTALAPHLAGAQDSIPYVTCHSWSPKGCLKYGRCLLAVVSSVGQVVLFEQSPNLRWVTTSNVTVILAERCRQQWRNVQRYTSVQERLKEVEIRVTQLRTVALTWCGDVEATFTRLLLAQGNNELVVCRVNRDGSPTLEHVFASGLKRVTSLAFTADGSIVAGDRQGIVKLFRLTDAGVQELRDVWPHSDSLAVSSITLLGRTILLVKQCYVIAVALDDSQVATHLVNTLTIGGICRLNCDSALVATKCGQLLVLTVNGDPSGQLAISSRQVPTGDVTLTGTCGLATAGSRVIFAALTCHTEMQDGQPTTMQLFYLTDLVDPVTTILNNPTENISQYYQHLEVIRLALMHMKVDNVPLIANIALPPEPEQFDGLTVYELKVWRWLTLVKLALAKKPVGKEEITYNKQLLQEQLNQMETLLAVHNACSTLTWTSGATRRYLESVERGEVLAPGPALVQVMETLALRPSRVKQEENEKCAFCGADSRFLGWHSSKCEREHVLPRCSISMRQVVQIPYLKCFRCNVVAVLDDEWQEPRCIFCDADMRPVMSL